MTVLQPSSRPETEVTLARPRVRGKFIFVGDQKLYVRGVTYGTFRPAEDGLEFTDAGQAEQDFAQMAANGINTVRTYTVPPRWLLDAAHRHGLRVMVGLAWEQHVTFLDDRRQADAIERSVRGGVAACAGHPAVLCYVIGNEIPAAIVRWHGRRRVEAFLRRLYRAAKQEDPDGIVTYVNYPTTEYLNLDFIDALCFNVYLESQGELEAYLARLQNLAAECPLVMTEIGLDSRRHGEERQAEVLDWQVRKVFAAGCAGAVVFAWTDEWYRGGYDIEDWAFGITDRQRRPKPALAAVRDAFAEVPFPADVSWPRISVVVCSHNGARTIRDCLEALQKLDYPDFEVIVVDDGSSDGTGDLAREYGFHVISTENRGLSSARNTGMEAATGEIVAYTDDDAYPDPQWLKYLAAAFLGGDYAGVGGPNIAPPGDGPIADCIANAPGGPVHVLLSDCEAEHIPGCNMAFLKPALESIGGFDPRFRAAGDDVDACWRLRERGWKLGFSPGAMVWHHRRGSVRAYWRQQVGYGKAEALLEEKWPEKYNGLGHLSWSGRLYGKGFTLPLPARPNRVYHGGWGASLFQSMYQPAPGAILTLPLMPEWYLVVAVLAGLCALGALWTPLLLALPALVAAVAVPLLQASLSASRTRSPGGEPLPARLKALVALLHLLQPLARLRGRIRFGLTPWRRRGRAAVSLPRARRVSLWSEEWRPQTEWVRSLENVLQGSGEAVLRGGDFDRWDLEVRGGIAGSARLFAAVEEHGAGKQLARFRIWPRWPWGGALLCGLLAGVSTGAAFDGAWAVALVLAAAAAVLAVRMVWDAGSATAAALRAVRDIGETRSRVGR
ncbi:MAG TPA: glycosyltransferase [Dehalococcoidia bacterium]|nr:glycosyltransferase [Dehalococcoidia bacterium]